MSTTWEKTMGEVDAAHGATPAATIWCSKAKELANRLDAVTAECERLRARVAELEDALRALLCWHDPGKCSTFHLDYFKVIVANARRLIDAAREGEKEADRG